MGVKISVSRPLPSPVILPVNHGNLRRIRAEFVVVESDYFCGDQPNLRLGGPCLKADGAMALQARSSYGGHSTPVLDLDLPADDRDTVETALRAWEAAWDAAWEILS